MQAPAKAPAKAPVMGLHHEPEHDFQCRTHQNLYFSERENPALSGFSCCSPDDTVYIGNIDFGRKPMKITFSLIAQKVFHANTSYLSHFVSTFWALLCKCNCDFGPRLRSPDRRSPDRRSNHRIDLKLALNRLNTFLVHQWLCLTKPIYVHCKLGPLASF